VVLRRLSDAELDIDTDAMPAAAFAYNTEEGCLDPMVEVPAETLLIVATSDVINLVRAGEVDHTDAPSTDNTRRIVSLKLNTAPQPLVGTHVGAVRDGRSARSLLYCADTLGCVQRVLDKTTEYAKQRTTFGSPIGKYQAVAHRLVDHAVVLRQMRCVIAEAAKAFDRCADDLDLHLAIAETHFWGRGMAIISDCIQLCGGIGFTWEWGHHFYLNRAIQNTTLGGGFGRPGSRLARAAGW